MEFKVKNKTLVEIPRYSINRIRLEFKVMTQVNEAWQDNSINRIRLEFKDMTDEEKLTAVMVLIESDWNLKYAF